MEFNSDLTKYPSNWRFDTIENYSEKLTDYVANGSFASLKENVKYMENEGCALLIRLTDYNNGFKGPFVYLDEVGYEFLKKTKLCGGELIISNVGANVGTVFKAPKINKKMSLGPNAITLKTKGNDDFYYYWFKSRIGQSEIQSILSGSAQPKFNKTSFKKIVIPIPPLSEQNKIANFLMNFDIAIENNEKIVNNLEQLAQTLFKRWFVDFEFPNENGDPYKSSGGEMVESELGMIPAGWKVVEIKDICTNATENYSPKEAWSYVNYLDTGNITGNHISNVQHIDTTKQKLPSRARRKVQSNDIIYSTVRPNQKHYGMIREPLNNMLVSTGFAILRTKSMFSSNLLFIWLTQKEMTDKLHSIAEQSTSAYPSIRAEDIMVVKILQPFQDIIDSFNGIIEPQYKTVWELQQENQRLSSLRDVLLPKLLSGEIELPEETEVTEDVPIS